MMILENGGHFISALALQSIARDERDFTKNRIDKQHWSKEYEDISKAIEVYIKSITNGKDSGI